MAIIEIRDLSYFYPSLKEKALKNINLTVEKGDYITLTGPSGCGKTTLCRCLNGLIPHFYGGKVEGEVTVAGLSVKDHQPSELAQHAGLVFQNPENQLFALSVEKDIAFGLENLALPMDEIRRQVDWAMDLTNISDLREKSPHELSGGQQQRVAIACVLAMKPKIMILDEPTSFLDPVAAKKLFHIIQELNEKLKLTIILVEHRLDVLSAYTKRMIVMDKGEIKLDGSPREILGSKEASSIGIGIPKTIRLFQELIKEGVKMGKTPILPSDFAQEIRGLLKP